jgi:hypothetical protein
MNNINNIPGMRTAFLLFLVFSSACLGFGQTRNSKDVAPTAPSQTVDARQSGEWNVGIDPAKNVVRLQNSSADPLPVTMANTTGRQPFQIQAGMQVFAGGPSSGTEQYLVIPDGKRFVIENITANCEIPNGESITLMFLSRLDTTPNGGAMYQYIDLHSQGVFADKLVLTANHKTLAYAAYRLAVRARPTWLSGTGYATVTFSGYLENLPAQ